MLDKSDQEYYEHLRHSAAHLLAAAVLELRPDAKPTIGPAVEHGFYYDFEFDQPFSDEELPVIEDKMRELVADWQGFERIEATPEEARERFADNPFKLELIEELVNEGEQITLYQSGEFVDLCRGGHVEKPSRELQHFKLLKVAGAYWRGDEKQPMLTRIYGTAWKSAAELADYLNLQEEAKKRDHKILGPQFDLFTFSELVGSGLPLWTPKGALMRSILDNFVWELRRARGYQMVEIPHITKKELYEKSGHWDKFADELFKITTREGHEFAMKPMNCPHHTQIYDRKQHSYRELPQRYCNTTMVYRDEQTGELSGLSRVRSITQDDAHVFCRQDQVAAEMNKIWDIVDEFYSAVGFELWVRLSLADSQHPEKYLGEPAAWRQAEQQMRDLAAERGEEVVEVEGEAAFYGPKFDFMATDSLGREWQVATIQLDMNMPERFDLTCINEKSEKERVVMIHAAIMGSIERYISILIEHFAGKFPVWLAPVQVKVLPITDDHLEYAQQVADMLADEEVRVEVDSRSQTLSGKIRQAEQEQVPFMLVVGDKEAAKQAVAVRARDGEKQEVMSIEQFKELITGQISAKSL